MFQFLRNNAQYLSAGALLTLSSSFGQTYFISIFAGQIRSDFSLSHGEWGGLYAMATTASAFVMIWAGTLTDHFRVRVLGPVSLIFLSLACVAMTMVSGWVGLVLVVFALRFFGQGMLSHIAVVAMARWYVARRGKAIAIAGLGYALGEACLPLAFVFLLGMTEWRNLWIVAALAGLLLVPVVRHLLRLERTPKAEANRDEAAGMDSLHWSRIDVLRHPLFWTLVPAVFGPGAFLTALFFHQVHIAEFKGWEHAQLVALFPPYTLAAILATLFAGWALDKFGTARLAPYSQVPMVVGFLVIWATSGIAGALVGFILIGFGHGIFSTLFAAFWAEFYGTRFLGGIKSMVAALMVFGSAMGPGITGYAIDRGVSFPNQMPAISVFFLITSLLIWFGVRRAGKSLSRAA